MIVKHVHYTDVELEEPTKEGIKDVGVRWLISKKDGAKNFTMRLFEIKPGGNTPLHQHDWEHEIFVLEGNGVARDKTDEKPVKQGDVLFVPPNEWHQIVNNNVKLMKIICLIPYK